MTLKSSLWKIAADRGLKYRLMGFVADCYEALGDTSKRDRYRESLQFRFHEAVRKGTQRSAKLANAPRQSPPEAPGRSPTWQRPNPAGGRP